MTDAARCQSASCRRTAGLAEVDGAEIVAVALLGDLRAMRPGQLGGHRGLRRVVRGSEREVMHRAGALTAAGCVHIGLQGHMGADVGRADVADPRSFSPCLGEAEHVRQDPGSRLGAA